MLQAFNAVVDINLNLDEAWNGRGTALHRLERYSEAAESFTQALLLEHPLAQANLEQVDKFLGSG